MAKENETIADIIAEMRFHGQLNIDAEKTKPEFGILTEEGRITQNYADRLEAAHRREIDVLKQRCAELNAEVELMINAEMLEPCEDEGLKQEGASE